MRRLYAVPPPPKPPKPLVPVEVPKKLEPMLPTGLLKFTWFKILLKFSENVRL